MIKDFLIAIGNYKKYGELLKRKPSRVAGYVALLLLIASIGTVIIPTFLAGTTVIKGFWETIPEFTITHEGMNIQEEYDIDLDSVRILATNNKEVTKEDLGDSVVGILLDQNKVIIQNLGNTATFSYSEFSDGVPFKITKATLIQMKSYLSWIGIFMCVVMIVIQAVSYLLNSLFIGAVSSIIATSRRIIMPFRAHIKLALYAKTLPLVLACFLTPFGIPVYSFIEFGIIIFIIIMFFREIKISVNNQM